MRSLRSNFAGKRAVASAPGKIILFGEHAVVYDKPGIAAAVNMRSSVEAAAADEVVLVNYGREVHIAVDDLLALGREIDALIEAKDFDTIKSIARDKNIAPLYVIYKTGVFPACVVVQKSVLKGMGSSSSVFASIAASLLSLRGAWERSEVSALAYAGDVVAHGGTPSGIDNTVVTFGGYCYFRKSSGFKSLSLPSLHVVVIDSGEEASTAEMVSLVRTELQSDPEKYGKIMDELGNVTERALNAMRAGDAEKVGALMLQYYELLSEFGISTERLDEIVDCAVRAGALGAKPTGAWGGGICIALARDEKHTEALVSTLKEMGFEAFGTKLGAEGVSVDVLGKGVQNA